MSSADFLAELAKQNVMGIPIDASRVRMVTHLDVDRHDIQRAASEDTEHEEAWPVIEAMKDYGGDALRAGLALLESNDATERVVGCDLLGQLSNPGG